MENLKQNSTTDLECVEEIAHFLRDRTADYLLPVPPENDAYDDPENKSPAVFEMRVPRRYDPELLEINRADILNKAPYILVQMVTGDDGFDENGDSYSHRTVRLVFAIYETDEVKGSKHLLDLIDRVSSELKRQVVVGGAFALVAGSINYLIYTDDNYPFYFGEMSTVWSVPTVERECTDDDFSI